MKAKLGLTLVALALAAAGVQAQEPSCQELYHQELAPVEQQFVPNMKACKGNSTCIGNNNQQKAQAIKQAGTNLRACNKAKQQAKQAVVLKPLTGAKMDTTRSAWTPGKPIYTDDKGSQWIFDERVYRGSATWVLQRTAPVIEQNGVLRQVSAVYRDTTGQYTLKLPGRML